MMKSAVRPALIAAFAAAVLTGSTLLAQETVQQKKEPPKKKEAPQEKAEAKEETKYFQLDMIVIDVIEKLRDTETPNMSVVKPELFPLSLGTTLDTALERQPGVDIQRIQEVGTAVDDDSIKLRGLGARRIKVLRNGRPLNTPGTAGGYFIDWTMIPLHNVDRIEVVKGVGDPRLGNVLGGYINLVPKRLPTAAPTTTVQASGASFLTSAVSLHHGWKPGAFEYSVAAALDRSEGYLRNGEVRMANADIHLGYDLPFRGRLAADVAYTRIRKGFAVNNRAARSFDDPLYTTPIDDDHPASDGEYMYGGMGAYPEPGSWWVKNKWTFDLGYEQAFGESGLLALGGWATVGDREAYNTREALDRVFHKFWKEDRSFGGSAAYKHFVGDHVLEAGFEYRRLKDGGERNLPDDFRAPYELGYYVAAKNLEAYVAADLDLLGGRLKLTPGLRYLSFEGDPGPGGIIEEIPGISLEGWAPSLKLTAPQGDDGLFYASVARAVRMPALPEYYWHYDADDAGVDTSALPFSHEDGLMLQGGWRGVLPTGTRLEIAPYYYDIRDYIQFDLINFVAYNIGRARLYGLEIEAVQPLGRGWTAFANYTFQKSRTRDDLFASLFLDPADAGFDELPGMPAHKANAGVRYTTRGNLSVALFAQIVSGQKVIYNDNTLYNTGLRVRDQDGYARFDAEGRVPLNRRFGLSLFVRNILGADYQERFGFPAAGRTAGLALRAGF